MRLNCIAINRNKAVGWLSLAESAALEMRYTRKGIVSSNLTPTALYLFYPPMGNPPPSAQYTFYQETEEYHNITKIPNYCRG